MFVIWQAIEWESEREKTIGGEQYNFTLNSLQPNTEYRVRMNLTYTSGETFLWPTQNNIFKTEGIIMFVRFSVKSIINENASLPDTC